MPMYQEDSSNQLEVKFAPGKSLTLNVRPDAVNVNSARVVNHQIAQAERIQRRIGGLGKKADGAGSLEDFERFTKEIDELQAKPDNIAVMVDHVMRCVTGWTDYFPSKEAEARGELVPFTREAVEAIHPSNLGKIINALNVYYGMTDEDAAQGEASGPNSPKPLQLADAAPGSSPSSTSDSSVTAQ